MFHLVKESYLECASLIIVALTVFYDTYLVDVYNFSCSIVCDYKKVEKPQLIGKWLGTIWLLWTNRCVMLTENDLNILSKRKKHRMVYM